MATIKLSDFIMEQEVSTASCEDIVLEQLQAEIDVASSLVGAYAKQIVMMEYAPEYVQEGQTKDELKTIWHDKDTNFFKKLLQSFKALCAGIGRFFSGIVEKLKNRKANADAAAKALEAAKGLPESDKSLIVRNIENVMASTKSGDADIDIKGWDFENYKMLNENITIRSKKFTDAVNAIYEVLKEMNEYNNVTVQEKIDAETKKKVDELVEVATKYDHLTRTKKTKAGISVSAGTDAQVGAVGIDNISHKIDQKLDKYLEAIKYFKDTLIPSWTEASKNAADAAKKVADLTGEKVTVMLDGEKVEATAAKSKETGSAKVLADFIADVSKKVNAASTKLTKDISDVTKYFNTLISLVLAETVKVRNAHYTKKAADISSKAKSSTDKLAGGFDEKGHEIRED